MTWGLKIEIEVALAVSKVPTIFTQPLAILMTGKAHFVSVVLKKELVTLSHALSASKISGIPNHIQTINNALILPNICHAWAQEIILRRGDFRINFGMKSSPSR